MKALTGFAVLLSAQAAGELLARGAKTAIGFTLPGPVWGMLLLAAVLLVPWVQVKLKGVEEEDISRGYVLCALVTPCSFGRVFDAQIVVMDYKSIICSGYSAVLHIHCARGGRAESIAARGSRSSARTRSP